jgi:hypothetical protein
MVMVSAQLTRHWRLSYRDDLTSAASAALARRLVAATRRIIMLLWNEGFSRQPPTCSGRLSRKVLVRRQSHDATRLKFASESRH